MSHSLEPEGTAVGGAPPYDEVSATADAGLVGGSSSVAEADEPSKVDQAREQVQQVVGKVRQQGGGLLERVTEFAQRKPGAFLGAAAAAGFVTGRLLRRSSGDDAGDGYDYELVLAREDW